MAVKTVWDGKFIRFMEAALAQTEMLAGRVQIWAGGQLGYEPGFMMKYPDEFPFAADPPPTLASINPATAAVDTGAHPIVLTGTGFVADDDVLFNGVVVASTFVNATTYNATIPASSNAGATQVTVRDSYGRSTAAQAFTYTAAVLTAAQKKAAAKAEAEANNPDADPFSTDDV